MNYLHPFPEGKQAVWMLGPNQEVKVAGVTLVVAEARYRVLVVELPQIRMHEDGAKPVIPDAMDLRQFRGMFFDPTAVVFSHVPELGRPLNRIVMWSRLDDRMVPCDVNGLPVRPPKVKLG